MGIITNAKGEVVSEFDDTLEDWRQAAQAEAQLRREGQAEIARLHAEVERLTKANERNIEKLTAALHKYPYFTGPECEAIARVALAADPSTKEN